MPQTLPPAAALNPVSDPQILPVSYSLPVVTARFASPAAMAFAPQSLIDLLFRRK